MRRRFVSTLTAAAALLCATSAFALDRGFNTSSVDELTQTDYNQMANAGSTTIRLAFSNSPLARYRDGESQPKYVEANWDLMHESIDMATAAGLSVIIDPHHAFGGGRYTMRKFDPFFQDIKYANQWAKMLERLGEELQPYSNSQVWGIQPLNEPPPYSRLLENNKNEVFLNNVYKKFVRAIRKHNTKHRIILYYDLLDFEQDYAKQPSHFRPTGDPGADAKIHYDTHIYWPIAYTHQGHAERTAPNVTNLPWPDGKPYFTNENLLERIGAIETWRVGQNGVARNDILIGEWGVTQGNRNCWNGNVWNPSNGGRHWMEVVYNAIDDYHWTIHSWKSTNRNYDQRFPAKRFTTVKQMLRGTYNNIY